MRRCDTPNQSPSRRSSFVHGRYRWEQLPRPRARPTGRDGLQVPSRGGMAYNQRIAAISSEGSQTMGMVDEGPDVNRVKEAAQQGHARASAPRRVPCNDATGRVLPITPEEQAQKARAIAAFVDKMLAMPDEDPPGAWEEAMRDLDAHRPHRKLFEG